MDIIKGLLAKNPNEAYQYLLQLEILSAQSNELYAYFDEFMKLLQDKSSYVRMRGFRLVCAQAQWDIEHKIDENIDLLLHMLEDEKPAAIRQYLAAFHIVLLYNSNLNDKIENKLKNIDLQKFKDSMSPLIKKDIEDLRNAMI